MLLFPYLCVAQFKSDTIFISSNNYQVNFFSEKGYGISCFRCGSTKQNIILTSGKFKKNTASSFEKMNVDDSIKFFYDAYLKSFFKNPDTVKHLDSVKVYKNNLLEYIIKDEIFMNIINYQNGKKIVSYRYNLSNFALEKYRDVYNQKRKYMYDSLGLLKKIEVSQIGGEPDLYIYTTENNLDSLQSFNHISIKTQDNSSEKYQLKYQENSTTLEMNQCFKYKYLYDFLNEEKIYSFTLFKNCLNEFNMLERPLDYYSQPLLRKNRRKKANH